jgi:hypothetical protein
LTTSQEDKPRIPGSTYNLPLKDGMLAYRDHRQGDCILFLYAGIADSRMWLPHADALQVSPG